jgi:pteridine reductase
VELLGKVALVTGAGRRIGAVIAESLGAHGMRVAVHYRTSKSEAEATVARVEAAGGEAWCVAADLGQASAPQQLIRDVVAHYGALDVLVNSAASMERTPFAETTSEEWDRILALNTRAPFFLCQAAAPHMASGGAIVNIADLAAFETWPGYVAHGVSKSAVVYLTEALARVLAPAIRVNAVAPGVVLMPDGWDDSLSARLASTTPLRHNGSPQDVVRAVLYLLESDYVTGDVLLVDGGRRIR